MEGDYYYNLISRGSYTVEVAGQSVKLLASASSGSTPLLPINGE